MPRPTVQTSTTRPAPECARNWATRTKELRQIREASGLTCTEKKLGDEHGSEAPHVAGYCREDGPPDHDPDQNLAGSHPVAHPAARNLEQRIRDGKRRENRAHLLFR